MDTTNFETKFWYKNSKDKENWTKRVIMLTQNGISIQPQKKEKKPTFLELSKSELLFPLKKDIISQVKDHYTGFGVKVGSVEYYFVTTTKNFNITRWTDFINPPTRQRKNSTFSSSRKINISSTTEHKWVVIEQDKKQKLTGTCSICRIVDDNQKSSKSVFGIFKSSNPLQRCAFCGTIIHQKKCLDHIDKVCHRVGSLTQLLTPEEIQEYKKKTKREYEEQTKREYEEQTKKLEKQAKQQNLPHYSKASVIKVNEVRRHSAQYDSSPLDKDLNISNDFDELESTLSLRNSKGLKRSNARMFQKDQILSSLERLSLDTSSFTETTASQEQLKKKELSEEEKKKKEERKKYFLEQVKTGKAILPLNIPPQKKKLQAVASLRRLPSKKRAELSFSSGDNHHFRPNSIQRTNSSDSIFMKNSQIREREYQVEAKNLQAFVSQLPKRNIKLKKTLDKTEQEKETEKKQGNLIVEAMTKFQELKITSEESVVKNSKDSNIGSGSLRSTSDMVERSIRIKNSQNIPPISPRRNFLLSNSGNNSLTGNSIKFLTRSSSSLKSSERTPVSEIFSKKQEEEKTDKQELIDSLKFEKLNSREIEDKDSLHLSEFSSLSPLENANRIPEAPPLPPQEVEKINPLALVKVDYSKIFGEECLQPGLWIFRVEGTKTILLLEEEYGIFCKRDCYIILFHGNESSGEFSQIYIWRGGEASLDKPAIGSIRAVELNSYVGGKANVTNIEENEEPDHFLEKLPKFEIQEGGTENKFRNYNHNPIAVSHTHTFDVPRLYVLKWDSEDHSQSSLTSIIHIEPDIASLTPNQAFLLFTGKIIYIWAGEKCENMLLFHAVRISNQMNHEMNRELSIYDLSEDPSHTGEFFSLLGSSEIPTSFEPFDYVFGQNVLKIGSVSEKLHLEPLEEYRDKKPPHSILSENYCFIFDCDSEVFLWIGRSTSSSEKELARKALATLMKKEGRSSYSYSYIEFGGVESILFKMKFESWPENKLQSSRADYVEKTSVKNHIAEEKKDRSIDIQILFKSEDTNNSQVNSSSLQDHEILKIEIWILDSIMGPKFTKLSEEELGHFFDHDAYMVIEYFAQDHFSGCHVFFWQGEEASSKWWASWSSGFFPEFKKKLLSSGQNPTKELVKQRQETKRFAKLFNEKNIIVHKGKRRDQVRMALKNPPETRIYHIRERDGIVRAIQASNDSLILNTRDKFFILPQRKNVNEPVSGYLWIGNQTTNPEENEILQELFLQTPHAPPRSVLNVKEGEETEDFWKLWSNQKPESYQDEAFYEKYKDPKLFRCSTKTGDFKVDLIKNFNTSDIDSTDETFFLDTGHEIYLLSGQDCAESEKKLSKKTILDYLNKVKELRPFEITTFDISDEPLPPSSFTRHFHAWTIKESRLDPRQLTLLKWQEQERREIQARRKREKEEKEKREKEEKEKKEKERQERLKAVQELGENTISLFGHFAQRFSISSELMEKIIYDFPLFSTDLKHFPEKVSAKKWFETTSIPLCIFSKLRHFLIEDQTSF